MKSFLTVVCFVAALAAPAHAARQTRGGFGWFGPYVAAVNFDGLNAAFANAGITGKLESMHWMLGGGGYALVDGVVIGGSGWGGTQTVASDSLRARVEIGGGAFELGYSVLSMKHLRVAPVLGIGGGGYTIELQKLTPAVGSFGDLLKNPGRTATVSYSSFQLSPQLMITMPISFVGVQLKGGYIYSPMTPEWELKDEGNLNLGPSVAKGTPYASLDVVFGAAGGDRPRRRHRD